MLGDLSIMAALKKCSTLGLWRAGASKRVIEINYAGEMDTHVDDAAERVDSIGALGHVEVSLHIFHNTVPKLSSRYSSHTMRVSKAWHLRGLTGVSLKTWAS